MNRPAKSRLDRSGHVTHALLSTTAAVVLAAGAGIRFTGGTHKLMAMLHGRPVVAFVLDAVCNAGFAAVYVVEGAVDLSTVCPPSVHRLPNPRWETGQASSLQVAVTAATLEGFDAVVVGLGDQPGIPAAAWTAVGSSTSPLAVATYGGLRRNPVRLAAQVWPYLPVRGDEGARRLLASGQFAVAEIPCPGDPFDVDHPCDLEHWRNLRIDEAAGSQDTP